MGSFYSTLSDTKSNDESEHDKRDETIVVLDSGPILDSMTMLFNIELPATLRQVLDKAQFMLHQTDSVCAMSPKVFTFWMWLNDEQRWEQIQSYTKLQSCNDEANVVRIQFRLKELI